MIDEEIKAIRSTGIGGSDIGAILGLSRFKSPYDVYLDKIGEGDGFTGNNATHWGNILEAVVADEYSAQTGNKVQRVNKTIRHPDHEWAIANIDRAVVVPEIAKRVYIRKDGTLATNRILECKTANGFKTAMWGEPGSDFVPDSYFCQCQWYMFVCNADYADLAVLIGGQDFRIYKIERDQAFIEGMYKAARTFWFENVQKRIPPEVSTQEEAVKRYPKSEAGKTAEASEDAFSAYKKLTEVTEEIKKLKAEESRLKAVMMRDMGDSESIKADGVTLATWKLQSTTRLDSKLLKSEQPDIYNLYTKTSESRVFKLK